MTKDLDAELRRALRRRQPSPGFAARVASKLNRQKLEPTQRSPFSTRRLANLAAAAVVALLLGTVVFHTRRQPPELADGARARAELIVALGIASRTVNQARDTITDTLWRNPETRTLKEHP